MRISKNLLKILITLSFLLIFLSSVSSQTYLSDQMNQYYPFYVHGEQSDTSQIRVVPKDGGDLTWAGKDKGKGPPADYDNDGNIEFSIRDQATGDLTFLEIGSGSITEDFTNSVKPKQYNWFVTDVDGDKYPDLVFIDQNGNVDYYDNNDGVSEWNAVSSEVGGKLFGVGDVDKDGYRELVHTDGSQSVKYINFESGDSGTKETWKSISSTADTYSDVADFDNDGNVGVGLGYDNKFQTFDGNLTSLGNPTDGLKTVPTAAVKWDSDEELELLGAGNSNAIVMCDSDGCTDSLGPERYDYYGVESVIPPYVNQPDSSSNVTQGENISVKFNVTDYEGYTDIVERNVDAKFESPEGTVYDRSTPNVSIAKLTAEPYVKGSETGDGLFVPDDGKTQAFNATFAVPENANNTHTWNVTVQARDEKMTGTLNWTTFQVEKAVVEKNVSQSISVGREDTSRQTSLRKSQITALSFASSGLSNFSTNRLLTESLDLSSGKDRKQSLGKSVGPVLAFSRSGSNFKSTFSVLNSSIVAGSTVSDIFSTGRMLDPVFRFSGSRSATTIFAGSVGETFGLDISQGEGIIERTLELILGVSSDEGSGAGFTRMLLSDIIAGNSPSSNSTLFRGSNQSLNAQSEYSGTGMFFGSATQPLSIGQSFMGMPELFRSINQGLLIGEGRDSTALFGRTEAQDIGASNRFSRFNSVSRILNTGISTTQTFQVFDGVIRLLDQVIGVGGQQSDVLESSRGQETSIDASTGISSSQIIFRSFTQSLVASADLGFIDNYVNDVACRIFGQESGFCETNDDQNDQDTGNGGSDNGGSSGGGTIGGIGTGDDSNNESKDDESSGKQGDEKGSEDIVNESEQIKKVESSLKPSEEVDNIEKLGESFENLDRGQKVVIETTEDATEGSSGSSDGSPENGDMVEVEEVSFEVEENENKSELEIKTVESPEKLNLTARKDEIYEATNVSTRIDTANATLVYEVEKEFLSRKNASKDDIVVSRWKNGSKVQNLSTEIVNESSNQVIVQAYSPRGFSVFTVGIKQSSTGDPGPELSLPAIPVIESLKVLLILSSLYLVRKPLTSYLFTLDIRANYLLNKSRYIALKCYRRFIWSKNSEVGVRELEFAEDVKSLQNQKEALKFRKNKLEKEVDRKKQVREKYRRSLHALSMKIEKWEEKLED